jgi:hypothetical protein
MTHSPFILRAIVPDDRVDIIRLAADDADVERTLLAAAKHGVFPESWANDRASGCFLMTWPQLARPDGLERGFVLFAEQRFYVFSIDGRGDRVAFAKNSGPSPSSVDAVQRAIVEAFAVYGRHGQGPIDESGLPDWAVHPTFA